MGTRGYVDSSVGLRSIWWSVDSLTFTSKTQFYCTIHLFCLRAKKYKKYFPISLTKSSFSRSKPLSNQRYTECIAKLGLLQFPHELWGNCRVSIDSYAVKEVWRFLPLSARDKLGFLSWIATDGACGSSFRYWSSCLHTNETRRSIA